MRDLEAVTRRGPSFKHASGNAIYEVDPARSACRMLLAIIENQSPAWRNVGVFDLFSGIAIRIHAFHSLQNAAIPAVRQVKAVDTAGGLKMLKSVSCPSTGLYL